MEENFKIEVDAQALFKEMIEKTMAEFIAAMMPDEQGRKLVSGVFAILRKHGIDTATSMKIMMDLGELMKEVEDKDKKE